MSPSIAQLVAKWWDHGVHRDPESEPTHQLCLEGRMIEVLGLDRLAVVQLGL